MESRPAGYGGRFQGVSESLGRGAQLLPVRAGAGPATHTRSETLVPVGMFKKAYEHASHFTIPVVVSQRFHSGDVECGVGAAIVLNDAGWLATAAHLFQPAQLQQQHQTEISAYEAEVERIRTGPGTEQGKRKRLRALAPKKWIANYSYWWGVDGLSVEQVEILPEADLALGRLKGFDPTQVKEYPVFRKGAAMQPGASVCRLGFPFYSINATYDATKDVFAFEPGTLPIPRFPNEGIVTRFFEAPPASDGTSVKMVETSSPGLRGQSGGPLFDTEGLVWGMQSRTNHLDLGFSPEVERSGKKVAEHQFMSVGVAIHSDTVLEFGAKHRVVIATV